MPEFVLYVSDTTGKGNCIYGNGYVEFNPMTDCWPLRWIKGPLTLAVCIWFPLGCVVAVVRMITAFTLLVIYNRFLIDVCRVPLNHWFTRKFHSMFLFILGISIETQGIFPSEEQLKGKVIVSNHTHPADNVIFEICIYSMNRFNTPILFVAWPFPWFSVIGDKDTIFVDRGTTSVRIKAQLEKGRCVAIFPEGTLQEPGTGLIRFNSTAFEEERVWTFAAIYERAFPNVSTIIRTSLLWSYFWTAWQPWTTLTLISLGEFENNDREYLEDFVRKTIADTCQVPCLDICGKDK